MEVISKGIIEKCGILFVHGIVGNNRIFDFLQPLVPDNYKIRYVKLNGHGGDALAFSRASMTQWKSQVEEATIDLRTRCNRIIGVGHSMGCLLIMNQASANRLSGLFLLNPPMHVRPRLKLLTNALKVASGNTQYDPIASAAKEAYGISLDLNPLHYYGWLMRYLELFAEIKRVRTKVLHHIPCPVQVILSRMDEMVSMTSANVFNRYPDVRTIILPESTHYYYSAKDRELISNKFADFMATL